MRESGEKWLGDPNDSSLSDLDVSQKLLRDPFHTGVKKHGQVPRRIVRMTNREVETARKRLEGLQGSKP